MTNSKLQEQAISIKLCRVTDHLSSRMGLSFLLDIWLYRENITCPSEDKNFIFEYSTRYCTSECSERVRYRVEHEKIKFISTSGHVIFCLLYNHTNDDVFDDFPTISDHFMKISEDFSKLFRRKDELFRTFSGHFPKISEGNQIFSRRDQCTF